MRKKVFIILGIFFLLAVFGVLAFSKKAPGLLRAGIEKALQKNVRIQDIEYHFPSRFILHGFEVKEAAPFEGETCFYVEEIELKVSPMALSKRELIIDELSVENADVVIRQRHGKLFHALSSALARNKNRGAAAGSDAQEESAASVTSVPLTIRQFNLKNSNFRYMDYDAQEGGFVFTLDQINADIQNIMVPFLDEETSYHLRARLLQGRDQRPGEFSLSGWTRFKDKDTDATFSLKNLHLPYFQPYYAKVTPAMIREGELNSNAVIRIASKKFIGNIDFEVVGLLFETYESDNQLFGLKAEELLSFLKDSSGRLKFPISVEWDMADPNVKVKDVIRRSIERSLKSTILGNVGKIVQKVIQKIGESGTDGAKDGVENVVKTIKDFLKY